MLITDARKDTMVLQCKVYLRWLIPIELIKVELYL